MAAIASRSSSEAQSERPLRQARPSPACSACWSGSPRRAPAGIGSSPATSSSSRGTGAAASTSSSSRTGCGKSIEALPRLGLDRADREEVGRRSRAGAGSTSGRRPTSRHPGPRALRLRGARAVRGGAAAPGPPLAPRGGPHRRWCASSPSVEDEFGRLLTVVLDRTERPVLRGHRLRSRGAVESSGPTAPEASASAATRAAPGLGRAHATTTGSGSEKQRHSRRSPASSSRSTAAQPAHGIVLAGTGTEAGAVEPFLHPYLAERLIGTARLNPQGGDARRGARTPRSRCARQWERASERDLVQRDAGGRRERLGGERHRRDAARARPRPGADPAGACRRRRAGIPVRRVSGRLTLTERDCRAEGEPVPVLDVVDDAIEEALRQGVDVNVVYEPRPPQTIERPRGAARGSDTASRKEMTCCATNDPARSACSSPSRGSTATTAAPRWWPRRCATPAWRSSTPGCTRRRR